MAALHAESFGFVMESLPEVAMRNGVSSCRKCPLVVYTRQLDLRAIMVRFSMDCLHAASLRTISIPCLLKMPLP